MALKVLAGKSISDVRQRRALLETFVDKITIGKDGNVTITWDIFGYNPGDVEGLTNAINVRISDRIARHFDERTDSSVFFVLIRPVCPLKAIS